MERAPVPALSDVQFVSSDPAGHRYLQLAALRPGFGIGKESFKNAQLERGCPRAVRSSQHRMGRPPTLVSDTSPQNFFSHRDGSLTVSAQCGVKADGAERIIY
jgi:hypothetical protein